MVATAAIVHGSGPPFTYRLGQRPDREIRVNVKEFTDPQPDQDQQRAAGRGRPGAAVDGQRPGADQGPGRSARRPDRDHRQVEPVRGRCPRPCATTWKLKPETLPRHQGGHRHAPAPRQPSRPDRQGVRAPDPATASSAPRRCPATRSRAGPWRSIAVGQPPIGLAPGPPRAGRPRADRQAARARSTSDFVSAFTTPRPSARPCSSSSPTGSTAARRSPTSRRSPPSSATQARSRVERALRHLQPRATCSSSRARRSARSSSSCCGWSTRRPTTPSPSATGLARGLAILVLVAAAVPADRAITSTATSRGSPATSAGSPTLCGLVVAAPGRRPPARQPDLERRAVPSRSRR